MKKVIQVTNLSKKYDNLVMVDGISQSYGGTPEIVIVIDIIVLIVLIPILICPAKTILAKRFT